MTIETGLLLKFLFIFLKKQICPVIWVLEMKIRTVILLFILSTSCTVKGQDSLILGRWQILEIQRDSVLIFNRNNIKVELEFRFQEIRESLGTLPYQDSLDAVANVERLNPLKHQMFYEFSTEGNFKWRGLDMYEYIITREGSYSLDGKVLIISFYIGHSSNSYVYVIKDDVMVLHPITDNKVDLATYSKLERVEF